MRTKLATVGSGSSLQLSQRCFILSFALTLVFSLMLTNESCGAQKTIIKSLDDLNDPSMVIGGETETVSLRMAHERLPKAKIENFSTPADAYAALEAGKIDAVAYDRPPLEYAAANNPSFVVIPDVVGEGHIAVGAPFKSAELMEKVNEFIKKYREDGTYEDMYNRWVKTIDPEMPVIPKPENPINAGNPLVIGNDPQNIPMSFVRGDGSWSGFDTEFVQRLALYLNMDYRFESLYYDALFPACETGKLDLAVGNLDKTPERAETMLFSEDYIDCPAGIMLLKNRWAPTAVVAQKEKSVSASSIPAKKTLLQKWSRSFEKTFVVEGRWRLFANGLVVTLGITIAATILGTFFAFIQCYMRRSPHWWLRYPAKLYIGLVQGTPILVILLIMYYVVFAKLQAPWGMEKEIVATISLALNFAAYAGEMMRTGVDGINKGLIEAARALGFGRFQVFTKIIFPIACRSIIPVYRGEFISLLKTTSIVGYIATQDLTKASDIVRARTYEAFFPLVATAIIYLISAQLLASVFSAMEYWLNPKNRRKRAKGEVNV